MAVLAILLFVSIFLLILYGYPVAITLGGLSVLYALCFLEPAVFSALPPRAIVRRRHHRRDRVTRLEQQR